MMMIYTITSQSQNVQTLSAATACSRYAFPKVIGGITGMTQINSIDIHAGTDQLVTAGYTYDGPLLG